MFSKNGSSTKVKRIIPINWKYLVPGIVMLVTGAVACFFYLQDRHNVVMAYLTAFLFGGGGYLAYLGFSGASSGFAFDKKYTGKENAIILVARRNPITGKDMPVGIKIIELKHPPVGARMHYVRNLKKHFYELWFNPATKKLMPVVLPDKKSFPPELFQIPAAMQTYKEAIEYVPPTLFQKLAPGAILLAMGIVGILQVVTAGG